MRKVYMICYFFCRILVVMQDINEKILAFLLIEHGYDFTNYSSAHINRRISGWATREGYENHFEVLEAISNDKKTAFSLINQFSVGYTEMFRDPIVFRTIRDLVIPNLKSYPFIKIWHVGCSTGEEVYSMAILLKEEGIYDRCRIYATDINEEALSKARQGIYTLNQIKQYTKNYQSFDGKSSFSDYYNAKYNLVIMKEDLKRNIVWSSHNLVSDWVFNDIHLVFCRNVLIYFDHELQNRALQLFTKSLVRKGFLCLGIKETLRFSDVDTEYEILDQECRIYQLK